MLWPQKPRFYIANNYVMDDSFQKIVATSHPFFSRVLLRYGSFTPEDAGHRKDMSRDKYVDRHTYKTMPCLSIEILYASPDMHVDLHTCTCTDRSGRGTVVSMLVLQS